MRVLYPAIAPYTTCMLPVDGTPHTLYVEESGDPQGKPVVFVHGGPGGGTSPSQRQFFDPARYRIILFDQRGSGKSTPHASLEQNTTWDLVADMERIREHLRIDSWVVFGGSWGSTLSLAYAQAHPSRVKALVLRGIFLLRPEEIRWFYQEGANYIYPDAWEHYLEPIPFEERGDMLQAYYRRLTSDDPAVRARAAKAWSIWEGSTSFLFQSQEVIDHYSGDAFAEAFARIECHYFVHHGFFRDPQQLLDDVDKIRHIPAVIVQGRYDVVCPMVTAWMLHRRWPEAGFHIVADAGHAATEKGTTDHLVQATDRFADL